jgi:alkylmercury lyase
MTAVPSFDDMVGSLSNAPPPLTVNEQWHALTLLRILAEGQPVSVDVLGARTGQSPREASALLDRLPGVYRDEQGRVVGFWGLTVAHMPPHRYRLGDRGLFTWCAWDPFLLTPLLDGHATVASEDAHTGEAVGFRIDDHSVTELSHPGLTLSFTLPGEWADDVIATFCHLIHFFTSDQSARAWTATHPGTFVLPLEDAMALADVWRRQVLPEPIAGDG